MTVQRDLFGARIGEYIVPDNAQVAECRSCGAAITWTRTATGKAVPLSLTDIEDRDGVRYALTHFSDCPEAKEWSKKR